MLFAGFKWKIIRINEDGTIRLILHNAAHIAGSSKFSSSNGYQAMYYSNSLVKPKVESWYEKNIINKGYDSYVAISMFCEQAKKASSEDRSPSGNATLVLSGYTPNFKCATDGNGKGIINSKVGLITYDEAIHAGGNHYYSNGKFLNYLYYGLRQNWTMSPGGYHYIYGSSVWDLDSTSGGVYGRKIGYNYNFCPVISLNADVKVIGTGTETDPYVVQTN